MTNIITDETMHLIQKDLAFASHAEKAVHDAIKTPYKVSMGQLWAYAQGHISYPNQPIEQFLQKHNKMKNYYAHICQLLADISFGYAKSANTGGPLMRECEGLRIDFKASPIKDNATYMFIYLTSPLQKNYQFMVIVDKTNNVTRFALPKARENIIQIMIDNTSMLYQLLCQANTQICLQE